MYKDVIYPHNIQIYKPVERLLVNPCRSVYVVLKTVALDAGCT